MFNLNLDSQGLDLTTYLGNIYLPLSTIALVFAIVAVLRIRKVTLDYLATRKANKATTYIEPKTLDLWNDNPFDDFA